QNSIAQANSNMPQSTNSGSGQNLTPEQRNQIVNQVKAIIEKAKRNPNDSEAQLEAADQFIQISRPDEALELLDQARKINPDDERMLLDYGIVYAIKGQFEDSIKAAKRSLELNHDNQRAEMLLLSVYIQSKTHLDEAEKILQKLEASGNFSPDAIAGAREDLN